MTNCAFLLIGGNVGNRFSFLQQARSAIEAACGPISKQSAVYETEAWGKQDQAPFLNQALQVDTHLSARELLQQLLHIEIKTGRVRDQKFGPRMIDLDILFYNKEIICEEGLQVPHPRMAERRFVLQPLAEIAPGFVHPVHQKTIQELLHACTDPLGVVKLESSSFSDEPI